MRREARVLAGLVGLWGGAFAWTEAVRTPPQHAERRFTADSARRVPADPVPPPWSPIEFRSNERVVARDLFAGERQRSPAPTGTSPVAATTATPAPSLPAPSFRYVGFVADGNGRKVLLAGDSGVRPVSEGDVLEGGWRVERITAEQIELTHLGDGRAASIPRTP